MASPGTLGVGLVFGLCFGTIFGAVTAEQANTNTPETITKEVVVESPPKVVEMEVVKEVEVEVEVQVPLPDECKNYVKAGQEYANQANRYSSDSNSLFTYLHDLDWRLLYDVTATHETEKVIYRRLDELNIQLIRLFEANEQLKSQRGLCDSALE